MKLHLPLFLRKAILTLMLAYGVPALHAANLTLGAADSLSVDYSASGSLLDLNNGTLRLSGGTTLQLSSCGEGDGKTYILLTGVSELLDAQGNVISLDSTNNAASLYFDASQPGTGFWAGATLQLTDAGTLQLVLHNETVKAAITITSRQTYPSAYQYYAGIVFEDISFASSSYASGGAIYGGTITLSNNGSVTFSGNTASAFSDSWAYGGAIYGGTIITLSNNGSVSFIGNTASSAGYDASGGAIYGFKITLNDNGEVVFHGNQTDSACQSSQYARGGAVYAGSSGVISFENNKGLTFSENSVTAHAYSEASRYWYARAYGGAIYGGDDSTILLNENVYVSFHGNKATVKNKYGYEAFGGAIYGASGSTITLSNNGRVEFCENTVTAYYDSYGGAIYGDGDISLCSNSSVEFRGNTASDYGGAIYGGSSSTITLSNNKVDVTFSGNKASYGGAIYASGNLSIRNNESVEFYQNAEVANGTCRLRSIYSHGDVSLSAAAGKSITFRDSIYIGSGRTFKLNEAYEGAEQQGDIIFTGATTVDDLYTVKNNVAGTAEEIRLSRTTEVNTLTNLYGGRLRVEEGAIYQGRGITAMEGSAATVRVQNATLSHSGYDLTFNAGTTLELAGNNTIAGNVQMLGGSSLVFDNTHGNGTTDIIGSLGLGADVSLALGNQAYGSNEVLLYVSVAVSGWDAAKLTVQGNSYTTDSFTWVDNLLVLNYDETSFNRYFNGSANYNERHEGNVIRNHYESVSFTVETSNPQGGAIYGAGSDVILLSNNGSVSFSGNTATSDGGAIYGDWDSTITLSNNGSVSFSGNTASDFGGAIYGGWDSTITLSNNGSVTFSGNTASASSSYSSYAKGGAIYGDTIMLSDNGSVTFSGNSSSDGGAIYGYNDSDITLSNNGSVVFEGNTASSSGGAIYTYGDLSIRNNDSVEFYQNAEVANGTYRLRSVYANGYSGGVISLSSAEGKNITFRDSIYIGSGNSFKLNEAYEGTAQQGDIIFTGATTVDDLYTVKGNVAGTAEEIRLSRTTEVNTLTELYGGRLLVEEGAIYQGQGITAMEGSASTVRVQNATLKHSGYDLTFNAGTTLELAGNNTIAGNVQMLGSSSLVFDNTHGNGTTDIIGSLGLGADVSLALGNQAYGSNEVLLYVSDAVSGWDAANLTVQGNSYTTDSFTWVDNLLVLNYDESSFNRYFNGSVNYNERLVGDVIRHHYKSVSFTVETSSPQGGAIYGAGSGVISLSNIGSVSFSGNTASGSSSTAARGGAICGTSHSHISLSNIGSVSFSGNTASSSDDYANGGAIYGDEFSTIALSDNVSVTFSGNRVSSTDYSARGGAIYGDTITLSDNGSVVFEGNTASSSDYYAKGGAIYGDTITLSDNGSVVFEGNTASSSDDDASGGAIYTYGDLSIRNNDSVEFYQNAEVSGNTYRLRSIYAPDDGYEISLSAAAGKSITFRDSIYIGSGSSFKLNEVYEGTAQQGDIIFTGATTVDDLYTVKGNVAGTSAEIRLSRTSEIKTLTELYGGRLLVEEGAVYQGRGITAVAGSAAVVRVQNATLSHSGYDLTFNAGTTLELVGNNTVTGNLTLTGNSTLLFDSTVHKGDTVLCGSLSMDGGSIQLNSAGNAENLILLVTADDVIKWNAASLVWNGAEHDASAVSWVNNLLIFNHNADTFNPYFNGTIQLQKPLSTDAVYSNYTQYTNRNGVRVSDDSGIYADADILVSYNGDVEFSGNMTYGKQSGYALGGAVQGRTVKLNHNDSVVFTENSVFSESAFYALCGAAYAETLSLSHNGEVRVSLNQGLVALGGDIVEMNHNGSVALERNIGCAVAADSGVALNDNDTILIKENCDLSIYGGSWGYRSWGGANAGSVEMKHNKSGITVCGNSMVFIGHSASGEMDHSSGGGALGSYSSSTGCEVSISENTGKIEFSGNSAIISGDVSGSDDDGYGFCGLEASGGAISVYDWKKPCLVQLNDNEAGILFTGNRAFASLEIATGITTSTAFLRGYGGAVALGVGTLEIRNNRGGVSFIENSVHAGSRYESCVSGEDNAYGGAISGFVNNADNHDIGAQVILSHNDAVTFHRNSAWAKSGQSAGGALYGDAYTGISLNDNTELSFSENSVTSVVESDSYSDSRGATGGAIYVLGNLSIRNNGSVLFEKNSECLGGTYRLRSVYADSDFYGLSAARKISLSAAEGKSIEFRDSVYISGGIVELNADYNNLKQSGDIVFTGATTAADLYQVKGNRAGTEEEILASRTSGVYAMTNLYGGRLRVEAGAVYEGYGLTAHSGSAAVVRLNNASLQHSDCNIIFNRGTGLELVGTNSSSGYLQMQDGSELTFHLGAENKNHALLTHTGSLTLGGSLGILIEKIGSSLATGVYKLLSVTEDPVSWDSGKVTINGGAVAADSLSWVDGTLCFNYTGQSLLSSTLTPVGEAVSGQAYLAPYRLDSSTLTGSAISGDMELILTDAGTVSLAGCVAPGAITVCTDGVISMQCAAENPGMLSGAGQLTKDGKGTLILNDGNSDWTGDIYLNAGTLAVQGASSLGSGSVYVKSGTLDLNSKAVSNSIIQDGIAMIGNGEQFVGSYTLESGELQQGSVLNISELATLTGGLLNGTLSGNGEVEITGHVNMGLYGQITTVAISLGENGVLFTAFDGLNSPAASLSMSGGSRLHLSGNLAVGSLVMDDAVLTSGSTESVSLAISGDVALRNGAKISVNGGLCAANLTVNDSSLRLMAPENQKISLSGDASFTNASVSVIGAVSAAELKLVNSELYIQSLSSDLDPASYISEIQAQTTVSGGCLSLEHGAVYQGGGVSTVADSGAVIRLRNASMLHAGCNLTFQKGTKLELSGINTSSGNLMLQSGSALMFNIGAVNKNSAVLQHAGALTFGSSLSIELKGDTSLLASGSYKLLTTDAEVVGWDGCNIVINGGDLAASALSWVDDTLCFNYDNQEIPDIPGGDTPGGDIPGGDIPGGDTPGGDTPGGDIPGGDTPGGDTPGGDTPGGDTPGGDTPGGDTPGGDIPGGDTPGGDTPGGDIPGGDTPGGDTPGGDIPGGDTPGGDIPGGDIPGGDTPGGDTPGGDTPGGDTPGGDTPGGDTPGGDTPGGDTPVQPDKPEKPEPLNPLRPGAKPVLVGGDIDKNTEIILTEKGNVTLEGKVNAGAISVNCDKNITFKSTKKKPGSLMGDGDLTKKGKGTLTLNDGNSSWTGDTYLQAGTIKVKGTTSLGKGDVYVQGGVLNLGSKAIANDIVQEKSAAIKSGKKFTGTYTLESGELQKGSTLNINKTATLAGGTVNGTLSGSGKTTVTGKVKLGDKGKITTKALTLGEDATLTTSAKGLSSKTTTLSIGEDATLSLGGKMTVDSLKMNGGTLKTTASKPAAMTVKNNMELTDAVLSTNGKVTTNKLTLNNSTMGIKGAKAQNLTVKQALTIGSGSALTLNGKLSAGSLTIKSGGMLTMSGSKPVTLKVKGALTLNEGSSIILNYSFVQGKTYKVLTFGSYSGSKDYYSIFGVEADDCTITNTGKALTLTVTGKWKPQSQQKAVSADAAEPVVATKSQANPVADALVQANWGQLEASRAFVNAIANRSMAVQLGSGERAVWASAIGSSSRHDTAGDHNGADTNVSGGSFGLETQVGRASLFGLALGNSWTRVSAHGFGTIEQDTTHLGLYGQTNWRSGVTADWSAAYGRSESESMGSDWNQKHLQLDGRVSYNHELNARTQLSPFAGVQYYASDAAGIGTTDTGSLQNLRAEIGVAASHRTGKLGVYGEIAVHQDMARNNPSVSMEGTRYTGMNPGRTGLNFTVGASYELTDKWSVNASYTGEFVENANAHSANIGASYKF